MEQQINESAENGASQVKRKIWKRKFPDTIVALYLLTVLFILLGEILGSFLELIFDMIGTDVAVTAGMYLLFIGIWIVTLAYIALTKKNRPILRALWKDASGNHWKNLLFGFLLGFVLNGVCVLAAWLHQDISLFYNSFQPVSIVIIFVSVFVQSSAEELVCRGFLYQRLRRSYRHPAVAIIGSSALFALVHLFNDGVTILSILNIFTVGILFSFIVYYMDSIWCAMALHMAWNFTQNILFGLPNSGVVVPYSVFKLDAASASDSLVYNVGFGIEGTLLADVVLILACIGVYLWGRKYAGKPLDLWNAQGQPE